MQKEKPYIIKQVRADKIKRMNGAELTIFIERVYWTGFDEGKEASSVLTSGEIKEILLGIKGIGEKRAEEITKALTDAANAKGKESNGEQQ